MKIRILSLTLILLSHVLLAKESTYVVTYSMDYQPLKNASARKNATVLLLVNDLQSIYLDEVYLRKLELEKKSTSSLSELNSIGWASFMYVIIKENDTRLYTENLSKKWFAYSEPLLSFDDWQISDKTRKVKGYTSQEATINLEGRKWTAWFTTEIPINDGPDIFSGLPGLITRLESSDKEYQFSLVAVEQKTLPMPITSKVESVSKSRFKDLKEAASAESIEAIKRTMNLASGKSIEDMFKDRKTRESNINGIQKN